jgi:hypothetical protein
MNRQSGSCAGRQKDEKAVRKMYQAGRKMNRHPGRCTGRHKDEQAVRKMYRQVER